MKKILILASALSLTISSGCKAAPINAAAEIGQSSNPRVLLTDIATHWAKESILKAVDKQYIDGYEDATFRPELNVSRAEFLKMAVTAMKLPVTGNVTGSEWYKPYVAIATEKGILRASDFPIEDINKPISRLEMARISVRSTDATFQNKAVQIDDKSVMYNATKTGLIQGLSYGELGPDKSTTRAQSVTIIERILTVNGGGKLPVDKYAVSSAELALKKTNIFSVMPEVFGGKQQDGEFSSKWNPGNLSLETPDGNFKGTVDQVIAIDLEDPNDPNRGLIPNFDKLHWLAALSFKDNPLIKDYPKSYYILFKSHVDFNKDKTTYDERANSVSPSIIGFKEVDRSALKAGKLNELATVFEKIPGDMEAYILPKTGYEFDGVVTIKINAPAFPPHYYSRNILTVSSPQKNK